MKEKKKQITMRPESRTFDPVRFGQTLRNGQLVILLLMLSLWLALRHAPDFSAFMTDPLSMLGKLGLFAAGVWLLSAAKEALRCLGFHLFAGAKWEYIKFGVFFSRGGAVYGKCMAAVNASGYRWAVILPCPLLGWVPWAISLFWGNLWLYSAFAILSAGTWGDIRVLWSLRLLPRGSWVQDSPFAPGCDIYIPEA